MKWILKNYWFTYATDKIPKLALTMFIGLSIFDEFNKLVWKFDNYHSTTSFLQVLKLFKSLQQMKQARARSKTMPA